MPAFNFWEGQHIRLRAVEPTDLPLYQSFDQDSDIARSNWLIPFPRSTAADRQWIEKTSLEDGQNDEYRLTIESKEHGIVGNISTFACDRRMGHSGTASPSLANIGEEAMPKKQSAWCCTTTSRSCVTRK